MADTNAVLYTIGFSGLTHADISALTGKTLTTAEQTLCGALISSAESYFAGQCRRNFKDLGATDSYYQTFDAGKRKYYLNGCPIREVRKITLDGVTQYEKNGNSNLIALGTDFFVYDSYIYFDSVLNSNVNDRRALVIYYAIDAAFGADAKLALQQWVSELFLNREFAGKQLNSLSAGGNNMSFDATTIPDYIKRVISMYQIQLI